MFIVCYMELKIGYIKRNMKIECSGNEVLKNICDIIGSKKEGK